MKKLTSFMSLDTGEGSRIAFTYSEISDTGMVTKQNQKGNFLVLDPEIQAHVDAIRSYIQINLLSQEG